MRIPNHLYPLSLPQKTLVLAAMLLLMLGAPRTPVASQAADEIEVLHFTAAPEEVERDGVVRLSWQVSGVDSVSIQVRYGVYKQAPEVVLENLPARASLRHNLTRTSPDDPQAVPYIHNVEFWLITPSEEDSAWLPGYRVLATTQVQITCPYDGFFFGAAPQENLCPLAEAQTVEAVYQPFEKGFLLWRGDNDTFYVFRTTPDGPNAITGSAVRFDMADEAAPTPGLTPLPTRRAPRTGTFDQFLNTNRQHGILIGLGAPTAPETRYEATVQDSYNDTLDNPISYMSLPDDRIISYWENIYSSSWSCVTCAP